jgi:hypothetical protein
MQFGAGITGHRAVTGVKHGFKEALDEKSESKHSRRDSSMTK